MRIKRKPQPGRVGKSQVVRVSRPSRRTIDGRAGHRTSFRQILIPLLLITAFHTIPITCNQHVRQTHAGIDEEPGANEALDRTHHQKGDNHGRYRKD